MAAAKGTHQSIVAALIFCWAVLINGAEMLGIACLVAEVITFTIFSVVADFETMCVAPRILA